MLSPFMRWLNDQYLLPARRGYLVDRLSPHLAQMESVLDLGASDGRLSHELSQNVPATFRGVDVLVQPKTYIEIDEYDGRNLPFDDNTFDCVMIVDVLHHDLDPGKVVAEAKRVARKRILIKDHYFTGRVDWAGLAFMDWVGNMPYGIRLPYAYLGPDAWRSLFDEQGLDVRSEARFRYNFADPCRHVVYELGLS